MHLIIFVQLKIFLASILLLFIFVSGISAETRLLINNSLFENKSTVEASSDKLKIESNSGTATFSGDVEIKLSGLILKAHEVIINYNMDKNSTQEIKEVLAIKNVIFVSDTDVVKADSALYSLIDGTITLTGNVSIAKGTSRFSGEALIINLNTGEGTMSGRVTAILGSDN